MSWLKKSFSGSFCYNRNFICRYFCDIIRLNQRQHFSCLSKAHTTQLLTVKYKKLEKHNFSVLETIRSIPSALNLFYSRFSKDWVAYLPFYGTVRYSEDGHLWFKTLDAIDMQEFMTIFDMKDTFYSRFNIVELHVWMLLFSLPKQTRSDKITRKGIIAAMWEDSEVRGKLMDKRNVNFRTDFKKLNQKFQVSLFLYDEAYFRNDAFLSSILWYNFFNRSNVDPRLLEGLVSFVRCQVHHLNKLNFEALRREENKVGIWISPLPFVRQLKA